MKRFAARHRGWWLILIGAIVPLTLILGPQFALPEKVTSLIVLVATLGFGAMALWEHATAHATGEEWWQDDSSSGWRGY